VVEDGQSNAGRSAEVVGGGIVGLGTATLLARAGWDVRVHERHPELREVGASIGIKPGAAAVLRELGVLERAAPKVVLRSEERRDGSGKVLQSRELPPGQRFYNPLRQDLIDALRDAALEAGVEIRTSSTAVGVTPAGVLTMEDGSELSADLVVAADGFHSRLREALGLGRVVRLLPCGTTRTLFPRVDEEEMRLEYWSNKLRIGVAPTTDELSYAYLNAPDSEARAAQVPIDVDEWSARFPVLPRSFFQRIHDAGGVRHRYPLVYCSTWAAGRVAVVGDAAHALPSTLGIGASIGLVNGYYLVRALADGVPVEDALRSWDARRRPVTVRTQRSARVYDAVTRFCPDRLEPVRNALIKVLDIPWLNERVLGLKAIEI
jgi:2-polyprenyl-6-methoxyphenol hydroxylase-like FAD-dependent oxidoreductase